jgi:hypothetical protein
MIASGGYGDKLPAAYAVPECERLCRPRQPHIDFAGCRTT